MNVLLSKVARQKVRFTTPDDGKIWDLKKADTNFIALRVITLVEGLDSGSCDTPKTLPLFTQDI